MIADKFNKPMVRYSVTFNLLFGLDAPFQLLVDRYINLDREGLKSRIILLNKEQLDEGLKPIDLLIPIGIAEKNFSDEDG